MKKIFMIVTFLAVLCFCGNINAAEKLSHPKGQNFSTKYNLTLNCAEGYIEDEFWGCVESNKLIKCGNVSIPAAVSSLTRVIAIFIKIAAPLVLIIMGMIDIVKAVTASDEKKIKEAQGKFIKRLIPAVALFLIVSIIQFLVGFVADNTEDSTALSNCIDCMINDENKCVTNLE